MSCSTQSLSPWMRTLKCRGKRLGVSPCELFKQRLQGCIRGRAGLAGLEPEIEEVDGNGVVGEIQRNVDVGAIPAETRGGDTHDEVVFVIEFEGLSDHNPDWRQSDAARNR